jgi:polyhydroxyalkanoate synthesis regulator phasin
MTDLAAVLTAIVAGFGALSTLLIFILRRKTDLRAVDRTSGASERDSQTRYIETLQSGELATREELAAYVRQAESVQSNLTEKLASAQGQLASVLREIAVVRTDYSIAEARIDELSRRVAYLLHADEINGAK